MYQKLKYNNRLAQSNSNRKVSQQEVKEFLRLSSNGWGHETIAKKIGYGASTVKYHLVRNLSSQEYKRRHGIRRFTSYWSGRSYKNDRGETFQSSLEERVANWLYKRGVNYKMHVRLLLGRKTYYPDFYLPRKGLYIEVFGMTDLDFYTRKMQRKTCRLLAIWDKALSFISVSFSWQGKI